MKPLGGSLRKQYAASIFSTPILQFSPRETSNSLHINPPILSTIPFDQILQLNYLQPVTFTLQISDSLQHLLILNSVQ